MSNSQKTQKADLAAKLAAGMQKHFPTASTLTVGGATVTTAQIQTQLQTLVSLRADVNVARANLQAKLHTEDTTAPPIAAFIVQLVAFVRGTFGATPDVLADFGLTPRKAKTPLTTKQQVTANAKNAATREARGTKGKREKLAITGNVVGVAVTPITTLPAPAGQSTTPNGAAH